MNEDKKTEKILQQMYKELAELGYKVNSSYHFVHVSEPYNDALPVLLKYVQIIDNKKHKEGLIRGLGVKGYKEAVPILIKEYKKSENQSLKWAIGNTLWIINDKTIADELIELLKKKAIKKRAASLPSEIKDPEISAKETLLWALGATRDPKAIPVLKEYLKKEGYEGHALEGLKYFKYPELIKDIKPLLKHKKQWVRRKAERFIERLKKLDK